MELIRSPKATRGVCRYHFEDKSSGQKPDLKNNIWFADYSYEYKALVYKSGRTGSMDIYMEGNGIVTSSLDIETFPAISPDGNKITFCSDVNGLDKNGVVKTMDISTTQRKSNSWSKPKQLATHTEQEEHAHFSRDRKWLIYSPEEFGINDEQHLVQPYIFSPQMYD